MHENERDINKMPPTVKAGELEMSLRRWSIVARAVDAAAPAAEGAAFGAEEEALMMIRKWE